MTTSGRGGTRPGAGRKAKKGETDTIICRVKKSNKEWLIAESKQIGLSTGDIVDKAIDIYRDHPEKLETKAE